MIAARRKAGTGSGLQTDSMDTYFVSSGGYVRTKAPPRAHTRSPRSLRARVNRALRCYGPGPGQGLQATGFQHCL